MHYVKAKGILSSHNSMNIYRGCQHGCIYCDSRSTCYQMNHNFEDIEVKENALELLEEALKRKRKKCMIGTGSMSDPYMPLEKELKYTRQALELIEKYGFGATLITKSELILRDLDLLKRINQKTKCVVQMTLTTYDTKLSKIIEPNVCETQRRIEVLNILKEAGIPTVVWLCPILPFINDTEENLMPILEACAKANVKGIIHFNMGLTLREGDREYYYQKLDEYFPGLKQRYMIKYGNDYELLSPYSRQLKKILETFCQKHHILYDEKEIFTYMNTFEEKQKTEQISLFD